MRSVISSKNTLWLQGGIHNSTVPLVCEGNISDSWSGEIFHILQPVRVRLGRLIIQPAGRETA